MREARGSCYGCAHMCQVLLEDGRWVLACDTARSGRPVVEVLDGPRYDCDEWEEYDND